MVSVRPAERRAPARANALSLLSFFASSSLAEGGQGVILLWLAYSLTDSALVVGLVVALGYLPATLAGLIFTRHADRGSPRRGAGLTNLVLAATSLCLAVQQLVLGAHVAASIVAIGVAQVILSVAKMLNKPMLGRLIRQAFDPQAGKRVLELSSSASLIGQVLGAGLAGVLLAAGWGVAGLFAAAAGYALAAGCLAAATRNVGPPTSTGAAPSAERNTASPGPALKWRPALLVILVFSLPSSGALQYLTTLLVPLAEAVAPGRPGFYALLNGAATTGGFLAGIALSTNVVPQRQVLRWAMPAAAVGAVLLAVVRPLYGVALLAFVLALVVTCHVVSMQVLTNQVPDEHEVGQFAMVRNVVASLAKGGFSIAAGGLTAQWGADGALYALAAVLACSSVAWLLMRAAWRPTAHPR